MLAEIAEDNAGIRGKTEYRCITMDGRIVWIYDESVPQLDERGTVVATRGFMLDITDRKIAEQEVGKRSAWRLSGDSPVASPPTSTTY